MNSFFAFIKNFLLESLKKLSRFFGSTYFFALIIAVMLSRFLPIGFELVLIILIIGMGLAETHKK